MLQVKNIKKEYRTGTLIQKALDDVNLNLRDNEFVAILGPSGSGKTTLLNIIGGLDRYDSGDIIINGISTKKYSDRDWDSYRNHTIGFVFQSYNLIPHQTVLSNVELALTISGVGRAERRSRAIQALEEVGLGDQLHKKPNQMSGGQMQRVAIARALVNNPDILLADEPTGALDSATSVQVMELLKEVARDRLVVMVTHNPELAEKYATRTVTLQDGHITSDSDPCFPDTADDTPAVHKNMGKSSMSLPTAFALSVNNLFTKKARTLLTSFAGSIGIIGIALILALSSGANAYIQAVQEETLSEYPLQIYDTSFSTAALLTIGTSATAEYTDGEVGVINLVTEMFSAMGSNDLSGLKSYLDSGESGIDGYVTAIEYIYDVTPYIYLETDGSYRQVNPDETFTAMGFGSSASSSSLISSLMSTDVFYEMPSASALYEEQYTLLAGKWPENYNECIVVLTSSGSMSDLMMYAMGLRDAEELDEMVENFINEEDTDEIGDLGTYLYDDILGITFKLVNSSDFYEYDEEYGVWTDKSDNEEYVANLAAEGEELTIVGIVKPEEDALSAALDTGICYSCDLVGHLVAEASKSEIVRQQLADKSINVFTGEEFGSDEDSSFDFESVISIDEDKIAAAFSFDEDALEDLSGGFDLTDSFDISELRLDGMDLSSAFDTSSLEDAFDSFDTSSLTDLSSLDLSSIDISSALDLSSLDLSSMTLDISIDSIDIPQPDIESLLSGMTVTIDSDALNTLASSLLNGFIVYLGQLEDDSAYDGTSGSGNEAGDLDTFINYLTAYLMTDEAEALIESSASSLIDTESLQTQLETAIASYMEEVTAAVGKSIEEAVTAQMTALTEDLQAQLEEAVAAAVTEIVEQLMSELSASMETAMADAVEDLADELEDCIEDALAEIMDEVMDEISGQMETALESAMEELSNELSGTVSDAFSIDEDAFADAFEITLDEDDLTELLISLSSSSGSSYESNLETLGYVDFDSPSEIDIYPVDFSGKETVMEIIDDYNAALEAAGRGDETVSYTDTVGTLMSSVTTIIDTISYILIAFVAISLVVSSIMIGVITYISVLERRKEIGILRAMGASKGNISSVFNAETFIIGFIAGVLGVGLSMLLCIPGNYIIHVIANTPDMDMVLEPAAAVVLIALSVVLTLTGGLIPSRKAAKSDPVTALRTD